MANSLYKILCPKHEEETPSCTVYDDGSGFCFGCNTYFAKLDEPAPVKIEPEDLSATFAYIKTLPIIDHRGLQFPYDNTGYYITWPNDAYYKKRKWETIESGPKYKGAKGITKPWFNYNEGSSSPICVIVEGEVNAMSLHKACPDLPIYCPGGASNFTDSQAKRLLPILQMYAQIEIVVDAKFLITIEEKSLVNFRVNGD